MYAFFNKHLFTPPLVCQLRTCSVLNCVPVYFRPLTGWQFTCSTGISNFLQTANCKINSVWIYLINIIQLYRLIIWTCSIIFQLLTARILFLNIRSIWTFVLEYFSLICLYFGKQNHLNSLENIPNGYKQKLIIECWDFYRLVFTPCPHCL